VLVQDRPQGLRLIRQHDHALASGALARAWTPPDRPALPFALVLAVALHDVAWIPADREPSLDASSGRPHDFQTFPAGEKLAAYAEGLDRAEALHPAAGLLGSLHYAAFAEAGSASAPEETERFLEDERRRCRRLEGRPGAAIPGIPRERALGLLRFFDRLSLLLCLSAPGSDPAAVPSWLEPPGRVDAPGGRTLELAWKGEGRVLVAPFPLGGSLTLRIPFRDLPSVRFADGDALRRAWEAAPERVWELEVAPG